MKKWQKRFHTIATALGFGDKLKDGALTAEDQKKIFAAYKKEHNISFLDDKELNEDADPEIEMLSEEEQLNMASIFGMNPKDAPKTEKDALTLSLGIVKNQKEKIEKLAATPEISDPIEKVNIEKNMEKIMTVVLGRSGHTDKHILGIEHDLFSRGKWHTDLFVTKQAKGEDISEEDIDMFKKDLKAYFSSFKSRLESHRLNGTLESLDYNKMLAGEGVIDYSNLYDMAGEFIVRRTDLIFAYFRTLPSVSNIFPVISGVQNKQLAPTATFGELSQGYRKGRIFKGGAAFDAEMYKVDDVMFKFNFEDMIELERQYIGYLNKMWNEGSSIIKWSFVEWFMIRFGSQLHNEQQRRRVIGVAVPEQNVTANSAMLAADGALRAIEKAEEELKVLPFEELKLYDEATILDYVRTFWRNVERIIPSMVGYKLHANMKHYEWYNALWHDRYGTFTGYAGNVQQLPDLHPLSITWVPNMEMEDYKMWIAEPGNVQNLEDKPGEMLVFKFTEEFEGVLVKSRWKEGGCVEYPGARFKTKNELAESKRRYQFIFTNYPISELTLEDSISFEENTLFLISGNTPVTTVTDFSIERVYKLVASKTGDKLTKSGAFSEITADFTAGAGGDYIKVYAQLEDVQETIDGNLVTVTRTTGKFIEFERKVTV